MAKFHESQNRKSSIPQYEGERMNLFSYMDPTGVRDVNLTNEESHFFLNSQKQTKGGFIDAWSKDSFIRTTNNGYSISSSTRSNLSPSSLTLSMAMAVGNVLDGEMENIQEGGYCDYRNKDANFLSTHSWIPFASDGGPLAEMLHTGGAAATPPANPASPYDGKGESVSHV